MSCGTCLSLPLEVVSTQVLIVCALEQLCPVTESLERAFNGIDRTDEHDDCLEVRVPGNFLNFVAQVRTVVQLNIE